jgi:hypothetical protein
LFVFAQFYAVSAWLAAPSIWRGHVPIGIRWVRAAILLGGRIEPSSLGSVDCIALLVMGVVEVVVTLIIHYIFRARSRLSRPVCLCFHFFNRILPATTIPCHSSMAGKVFVQIFSGGATTDGIMVFVFSGILTLVVYSLHHRITTFSFSTIILSPVLHASWDDEIWHWVHMVIAAYSFLGPACELFDDALRLVFVFVFLLCCCHMLYVMYFLPMLRFFMNTLIIVMLTVGVANSIFAFFHVLFDYNIYVISLFPLAIGIAVAVVTFYWSNQKKAKIVRTLSADSFPSESGAEDMKFHYLDSLVFTSSRDAIAHLRVGLMFHADMIVDFSFLRYVIQCYEKRWIIFEIARICSFFPNENQFLGYCLTAIRKLATKSVAESYQVYQIKRIHKFRESLTTRGTMLLLNDLKQLSREAIFQVRGFWDEILQVKTQISLHPLRFLQKITSTTEAAFSDAIHHFPNDIEILREYCTFQIEAAADFMGAVETELNVGKLEQGQV